MVKKRSILVIVIVFLVILCGLSALFYVNLNKSSFVEMEATIKFLGNNYILVETDEGDVYYLDAEEEYNVGDRIDFIINDVSDKDEFKVGDVVKIDVISRNINFSIMDDNVFSSNDYYGDSNISNDNVDSDVNENAYKASDAEIVEYFNVLNEIIINYEDDDKTILDNIKDGFVIIVDFLFYNGEIKGKTFRELSNSTKIKVIQLAFSIDSGIERRFPSYKETISINGKKIYNNFKVEAIKLYLDVTTDICNNEPDLCVSAKEGLSNLKSSFSLTWDVIKLAAGDGILKLKEWYEIWREA